MPFGIQSVLLIRIPDQNGVQAVLIWRLRREPVPPQPLEMLRIPPRHPVADSISR
jgi:hypothetical protein